MAVATQTARLRWSSGGWAGVLGIAVAAIGVAIVPIWIFPPTSASGAEVAAFASTHRLALQVMMLAYTVGVTLWLALGAAVWARLRRELPAESPTPACFAAGLIGFVTLLLAGFTAFDILVYRQPGPGEASLLYDLTFGLLAMSGMPTVIAMIAYAQAVYQHRVLPRYTGHLATLTAAAHALLLLSFITGTGFFSLEGGVITAIPAPLWAWIAITGAALTR